MARKSYRKVPENLRAQIMQCEGKSFVIYGIVKMPFGDVLRNVPGLKPEKDGPTINGEALPEPEGGTWAKRNLYGWEIVRDDWPKVTKVFTHESPNFGDWAKGSHTVSIEREVYQREYFAAHEYVINYRELSRDEQFITVGLQLDRIFEGVPADDRELLFAINVFQESVGLSAIKPSDAPLSEYVASLQIDWEILPVGSRDEAVREVKKRLAPKTPEEERVIEDRLNFLITMRPRNLLTGTSGFARYVGAQFSDELVVFDNVRYGNAMYIMFEDWARLSKMSRLDLQASEESFERVVHTPSWKLQARAIIRSRLHLKKTD